MGFARRQTLHKAGEHAPDVLELRYQRCVQLTRQEPEIPGEKQIILKFVTGTQGVPEEPAEVRVGASAAPSAMFEGIEIAARKT